MLSLLICTRTRKIDKIRSTWQTNQFQEISQHIHFDVQELMLTKCVTLRCCRSMKRQHDWNFEKFHLPNTQRNFNNFCCCCCRRIHYHGASEWIEKLHSQWQSFRLRFCFFFLTSEALKLCADSMIKFAIFSNYRKCLFSLARCKSSTIMAY